MSLFTPHGHLKPFQEFRALLAQGADPNEIWHGIRNGDPVWHLPLLQAAKSAVGLDYLRLLLANEYTDLGVVDMECRTALHLATAQGHADAIRCLLHAGVALDAPDTYGATALHYSCHAVDEVPMRLLLEAGADPNLTNQAGRAALHEALMSYSTWPKPYEEKVALLLKHGARVNQAEPEYAFTPLYSAASAGWARITSMLLDAGANAQFHARNGERPIDAVLRQLAFGAGKRDAALRATYTVLVAHDRKGLMACVNQIATRLERIERRAM